MTYLREVIKGDCYSPKLEEIKFKVCLCPPSIDDLVAVYEEFLAACPWESEAHSKPHYRLLTHMKDHKPDKHWLLGLLSLLAPNHAIWQPGYRPRKRPREEHDPLMAEDPGGFYGRCELLSAKQMKKGKGSFNPMTRREKAELELKRLNEMEEKLQLRKQKKEADLLLLNDDDDNAKERVPKAGADLLRQIDLLKEANPDLYAQFKA